MSLFDKAKDFIDQHDEQVDDALDKAGDLIGDKTGGKYDEHIAKGVDFAQEHTGEGDTNKE